MSATKQKKDFPVVDLGEPEGGRYWVVTSGHAPDHPNAIAAAVNARATGSVGATFEDRGESVTVRRPPKYAVEQIVTHCDDPEFAVGEIQEGPRWNAGGWEYLVFWYDSKSEVWCPEPFLSSEAASL